MSVTKIIYGLLVVNLRFTSTPRSTKAHLRLGYEFPLGTRSFQCLKNQTRTYVLFPMSFNLIYSLHLVLTAGSALI